MALCPPPTHSSGKGRIEVKGGGGGRLGNYASTESTRDVASGTNLYPATIRPEHTAKAMAEGR